MPVRIYALAKELDYDSKELVDVCKKAGITGKGSALASLDDDEVQQLKDYLNKSPASAEDSTEPAESPQKPSRQRRGPIKVVASKKPGGPLSTRKKSEDEEEHVDEEPVEEAGEEVIETLEATTPPEEVERPRRRGLVSPGAKIKVIGRKAAEGGNESGKAKPRQKRRDPVIKLASVPQAKQPAAPKKPEEKRVKPAMTLSDALKSKVGKRGPLQHLTKGPEDPQAMPEQETGKRGKKRKGKERDRKEGDLAGMASARADRKNQQRRREQRGGNTRYDERGGRRMGRRTLTRTGKNTAAPRKSKVTLELPCSVRSFSEAAGLPAGNVQMTLMGLGAMLTINDQLDEELAEMLAIELGVEIEFKQPESLEESLIDAIEAQVDDESDLSSRPPVITFLGHVDHGKTSLLDYLIGIDVVSGEAGGITQHIRAFQTDHNDQLISFVDTPGHEAFTEMRARGANVTDIAVLVVAADDGVMPQTEEAISHAKAAGVPIIVALNKIDLPGITEEHINTVLGELPGYDLTPSEWGGDVEVVRTSAIDGTGMDDLRDTILGIAELHEYQANANRDAIGVCLESEQETARGVIAKVIVQNGTLRVGDVMVCGSAHGRVKAMYDTLTGKPVEEAGPSTPVNIAGLDIAPDAGDKFHVVTEISDAREVAELRSDRSRASNLSGNTIKVSFDDFQRRLAEGSLGPSEVVTLNLIIRTDVRGSIEAIQKELGKLQHDEVQVKILQASVGGITAADIVLADASEAVVIGFNVAPDNDARRLADEKQVEIRRYDVIYKVTDDIRMMLEGKLKPEEKMVELGHAMVQQAFSISRVGTIAGCRVVQGNIERNCRIRVIRDGRVIGDYGLDSLRREKEDVKSVRENMECGIKLAGFNDVKQDDILEAYKIEEVARTL